MKHSIIESGWVSTPEENFDIEGFEVRSNNGNLSLESSGGGEVSINEDTVKLILVALSDSGNLKRILDETFIDPVF